MRIQLFKLQVTLGVDNLIKTTLKPKLKLHTLTSASFFDL